MIKIKAQRALVWLLLYSLSFIVPTVQADDVSPAILQLSMPSDLKVQGEASNETLAVFDCVLEQLSWPYTVKLFPWKRAIESLKQGGVDAIFMAIPTDELESIAKMSAPFALEKWYWFYQPGSKKKTVPLADLKIGVVNSSHTEIWLERQGLEPVVKVNSTQQLLNMLMAGRIDTFLADEELVSEQLLSLGVAYNSIDKVFSHYMPLGVYFSNQYLQKLPLFLTGFNNNLKACNTKRWQLNAAEKEEITRDALELQTHFAQVSEVAAWLLAENKTLKQHSTTGPEYDELWMAQVAVGSGELLNKVELHPLSQWLRVWQAESNGLISEIYVTGIKGFNMAESLPTSDFDQSDEIEYESVILGNTELFISDIEYDESAQAFQVKVAWAIKKADEKIGMIVIGINVEASLKN